MLCLLLFQCKLHWVALHRISEQCSETAIVQNRKQLLAVGGLSKKMTVCCAIIMYVLCMLKIKNAKRGLHLLPI